MTSAFDPTTFLHATYSEGADTRTPVHQPGEWSGYIGADERDIQMRTANTKDGERTLWEVYFYSDDPKARDPNFPDLPARVRYSMWLDLAADGKSLDFSPGKNRGLGFFLTALGYQDKTGRVLKPWSPKMWAGQRIRYTVKHEARKDTGEIVANVADIAAA